MICNTVYHDVTVTVMSFSKFDLFLIQNCFPELTKICFTDSQKAASNVQTHEISYDWVRFASGDAWDFPKADAALPIDHIKYLK